jgi:hypothetical protein
VRVSSLIRLAMALPSMSVIQNEWRAQGREASSNRESRSYLEKIQNLLSQ